MDTRSKLLKSREDGCHHQRITDSCKHFHFIVAKLLSLLSFRNFKSCFANAKVIFKDAEKRLDILLYFKLLFLVGTVLGCFVQNKLN